MILSVCMITYNHEKYIAEAIESVLMQKTNFDIELVIGEDYSTDATREICLNYQTKYPTIIKLLLPEQNIGAATNFINTSNVCSGKYIALLEGDDYWTDPLKLQKQVDLLENNPHYSGCFHETKVYDYSGSYRVYGSDASFELMPSGTFTNLSPFHTSSFVFRKSALQLPDWFSKVISGDMALFSIVSKSGNLAKIPEIMSIYRKHGGGITETGAVKNNLHQNRITLLKYLNSFHEFKYDKKANEIIKFHENAIFNDNKAVQLLNKIYGKLKAVLK